MGDGLFRPHLAPGCSHYWVIEAALGVMSRGACSICGEERLFRNHPLPSEFAQLRAIPDRNEANEGFATEGGGDYQPFPLPRGRCPKPRFV